MADYQHKKYVIFQFILLFSYFINISYGYDFVVGGRDGWVLNPSENYDKWAQRNRFQVNDTLLFKYDNGSDSVLVVNKNDHDSCHTGNPILKLTGGNSVFKFDRSGPFYFISGNKTHCDQGQKLIVVVLAVRNRPYPPPASGTPAPFISPSSGGATAPAGAPATWSPSPANGAPSPSTRAPYPATVPAVSPTNGAPSPSFWSPSPVTEAPSPSFWSQSPLTGAPSPAVSPGPPSPVTGAPSPGISGSGPSPAGSGNTTAPADGGSPRRSLAAPVATPSILIVSFVLSMAFGGFIVSN